MPYPIKNLGLRLWLKPFQNSFLLATQLVTKSRLPDYAVHKNCTLFGVEAL